MNSIKLLSYRITIITALILFFLPAYPQGEKKVKVLTIAFYNIENLFDTIDQPDVDDAEFLPSGVNKWTPDRYMMKLDNMAEAISQVGSDVTKNAPVVLGLSEIENRSVIEDLINTEKLKPYHYEIAHYDSPDERGVDVGLIYQSEWFKMTSSKSFRLNIPGEPEFLTRDQLLVSGMMDGEEMHFIVNHWPSRRGGEKRSKPYRIAAARLCRSIVDSIIAQNADAKIFIMGDLNDDPVDISVKDALGTVWFEDQLTGKQLFNPMGDLYKKGIGSLAYRDSWNLFDQIIMTKAALKTDGSSYHFYKAKVFNKEFLIQQDGQFKGYPFRTYVGNTFMGGYSDHFPVYVYLVKEL